MNTTFDLVRLAVFGAATVALFIISRRSLRSVHSHGFYRFFAWDLIVALVLLNASAWFEEPFSALHSISWFLLCASIVVLVLGVAHLRRARPTLSRTDRELYTFEKTSRLVTTGIYRYLRHPLYASLLYLAGGAWLKDVTWPATVLVAAAGAFLVATAKADERECIAYFGPAYEDYMRSTSRFVPFLF